MKITHLVFILILSFFFGCSDDLENVIIKGHLDNSHVKKVYFTDAHKWETLLDSAEVNNGNFIFKIPKKNLLSRPYSIGYFESTGQRKNFEFQNHILSPDSIRYLITAFIIDTSEVVITSNNLNKEYYSIKAGRGNEAFLSTQMLNFGYVQGDGPKRNSQINQYLSTIKKYPESRFLLEQIYENRTSLTKVELAILLNSFEKALFKNPLGIALKAYSEKKVDIPTFKNFTLLNEKSKKSEMLNSNAKLQMLVFWASWCGPCIKEIPDIVKLNELYKSRGLLVTSISIDNEIDKWEAALKKNKMSWLQLIVPSELSKEFATEYEIGIIPYILFLDSSGKLVDKFVGYDNNNFELYRKTIESRLK